MKTAESNTVLLLTDFSKNSDSAAEAGIILSGKLNANLLIYHSCIDYTMTSYGDGARQAQQISIAQEDKREALIYLTDQLEKLAEKLTPTSKRPFINYISDDNMLNLGVKDIAEHHHIELIVMGARGHSTADTLYGYDTNSIIGSSARPVLFMIEGAHINQIQEVIFATDYEPADIHAIRYLMGLAKLLSWRLKVIHIADAGSQREKNSKKQIRFEGTLELLKDNPLEYQIVYADHIGSTLNHIGMEANSTLLAMLHREHSFLTKIFRHSTINEVLANQQFPLLIFPDSI